MVPRMLTSQCIVTSRFYLTPCRGLIEGLEAILHNFAAVFPLCFTVASPVRGDRVPVRFPRGRALIPRLDAGVGPRASGLHLAP